LAESSVFSISPPYSEIITISHNLYFSFLSLAFSKNNRTATRFDALRAIGVQLAARVSPAADDL
jgi:hypothetical protein